MDTTQTGEAPVPDAEQARQGCCYTISGQSDRLFTAATDEADQTVSRQRQACSSTEDGEWL